MMGDDLTNVQYKLIWNGHNESPLYNKHILIKKGKKMNCKAKKQTNKQKTDSKKETHTKLKCHAKASTPSPSAQPPELGAGVLS
jgi:hypothetical protein